MSKKTTFLFFLLVLLSGLASPLAAQTAAGGGADNPTQFSAEDLPEPAAPERPAAAQAGAPAPPGGGVFGWDIAKTAGAFILVLALLVLALKGLGRLSRFRRLKGQSTDFEMRGVLALDSRKYLAAVAVDGRLLILGVTPDRISPLAQWPLGSIAPNNFDLDDEGDPEGHSRHVPDISIADD